jgi:lipopolysaccharide/colanic/teichoic acid biosynthesis glycosyltransferase
MTQIFSGKNYRFYIKRVVDIFGAVISLLFFSPLAIIISVLIIIDSKGPILADVPERIGEKGKKFKMFKFRSMIINAHYLLRTDPRFNKLFNEYKRSSYKLKKDPRVTKVGKFIRRHSIDEIPQLINVIRGEMSLVGPRAYYPDELENQLSEYPYTKKLVNQVLSVKPGITGLWQVTGRSEINFDKRIMIDADYVKKMSLWNDLKIIFLTPIVMISGKGAV